MKTVAFVQEFGANLGHVSRFIAIAKHLPPTVRKVFVVPHPHVAIPPLREAFGADVEIIPAPRFCGPIAPDDEHVLPERSLGDVFFNIGYGDIPSLERAAARWQALLAQLAPDLLVCDFAPTVRLAVWDQFPTVQVGCGYVVPPAGRRLPAIHNPRTDPPPRSVQSEDRVYAAVRTVRAHLGGPPLAFFADLFDGDRVYVAAQPILDPYDGVRSTPTVPPFAVTGIHCGPAFEKRTGPHIFCHLWSSHPSLNLVLTALNGIARPSQVHIRDIDPAEVARNCAPQVGIRTGLADFRQMLPQTRLFIHYGGSNASYAALLAGCMQIVLPFDLEKDITAIRMAAAGGTLGIRLDKDADVVAFRRIIEQQLDDTAMQAAALATAAHQHRTRRPDPLPGIAEACMALLG